MKLTELNGTLKSIQEQLDKAEEVKATLSKIEDVVGMYGDDLINEIIRIKDLIYSQPTTPIAVKYPASLKEIIEAVKESIEIDGMWLQSEEAYMDTDTYGDEITITLNQGDQYRMDVDDTLMAVEDILKQWEEDKELEQQKKQEQEDKLRLEAQEEAEAIARAEEESIDESESHK